MRAERLVAKIHADNTRSLKAFQRCGFLPDGATPTLKSYAMTSAHYLQHLRAGTMGDSCQIHITEVDQARLRDLVALELDAHVVDLEHEIERAIVVDARQVARNVVTMNSRALLHLDDEKVEVALVYPQDADDSAGKLSVYSDIGTAILGYKEGDAFDWRIPNRTRRISIEKVLYQPEAAGDFDL